MNRSKYVESIESFQLSHQVQSSTEYRPDGKINLDFESTGVKRRCDAKFLRDTIKFSFYPLPKKLEVLSLQTVGGVISKGSATLISI